MYYLWSLDKVLKNFPGVSVVLTRNAINKVFEDESSDILNIFGFKFPKEDICKYYRIQKYRYNNSQNYAFAKLVSPVFARILLSLYEKGSLLMKKGENVSSPSSEILSYISFNDDLLQYDEKRKIAERIDLNLLTDEDFSYNLLNKIFWQQDEGKGICGFVVINGIEVARYYNVPFCPKYKFTKGMKNGYVHPPNSFSWMDKYGNRHEIFKSTHWVNLCKVYIEKNLRLIDLGIKIIGPSLLSLKDGRIIDFHFKKITI